MHHMMHLVHQRHGRPQAPHELAPAAQRACRQPVLGLRCFENSQSRPHRRSRALLSRDWVRELPQPAFRHRHLIRPELVLPFRFIGSPHTAQQGVFIHPICHANSKVTQPLCRKA
ncbi:hypothetical protein MCC01971_21180 [Bifidobacteriaceae bacterium MCC01971]|nr:hypothetical protein MCC01971_21180 [Bifidobacteriaceae bacterium MCC01971]